MSDMWGVEGAGELGSPSVSGGVGPAELEPVAPVGADHMLSGEDETGPERGEEAGGESCGTCVLEAWDWGLF